MPRSAHGITYLFDAAGRTTRIELHREGEASHVTDYRWRDGLLVERTLGLDGAAPQWVSRYTWRDGRLTTIEHHEVAIPGLEQRERLQHDATGRPTRRDITAEVEGYLAASIRFHRNGAGRRTRVEVYDEQGQSLWRAWEIDSDCPMEAAPQGAAATNRRVRLLVAHRARRARRSAGE